MKKTIIDGGIFNKFSTETLTEIGLTPYQIGIEWYKRSGNKSVNDLVEYFTKDEVLTEEGYNILGTLFSDKYSDNIHRIYLALNAEYNPIENYDRKENVTDKSNGTSNSTSNGSGSSNETVTNNVSAYDTTAYQPESQNISSNNASNTSKSDLTSTNTNEHEAYIHGNIGVTTNQQMINEELKLRTENVLCDMIIRWADDEFLIKIYE